MSFDEKTVRVGVVPKFKLTIDHYAHAVWVDHATGSKGLNLTRMEFRLLDCMARQSIRASGINRPQRKAEYTLAADQSAGNTKLLPLGGRHTCH